ncbi:MAG: nitronate monooxygenase, partial [Promethearchaeota archaeon]
IPIIAAGGIGDVRGFLGALAMGADAVCFGTVIMSCTESPSSKKYKQKLITHDIYDDDYYKKIYHLELKDSPIGSMALGHCDEIIPLKEFIQENIIKNAENLLKSWGVTGDLIDFSKLL